MVFIWGSKRVESNKGWVADFCPLCRTLRPFQLKRVGMASHVYYVSFGEGKLLGYTAQCGECGLRFTAEPSRYAGAEKKRNNDLESLVGRTFPAWRAAYAGRLALEEQLRNAPTRLPPEQRKTLLMEPFALLNQVAEDCYTGQLKFDRQSSLGCFGTILLSAGLFIYGARALQGVRQDNVLVAALILAGLGALYTLVQLFLARRRIAERRIIPSLARALGPLKPTLHELEECLDRCQAVGMRIGKVIQPDLLSTEIQNL